MAVVTQTMQDQVTELYLGFFGRAPDAAGFGYWTEKLANGTATVEGIANGFSNTPEFVANYGGLTPVQQVTKIYLNVLNRDAHLDASGLSYWTGLLNSGSSIGSVVYGITNAAFAQTGTADGLLVQNKVTVGEYFAITLASNDTAIAATAYNLVTSAASSVVAAEAAITQGSGGTWALTTGIDTLVHGPFANFVGTVTGAAATQTLNAGDTITGVGAGNVLRVVDSSAAASALTPIAGVALTGVQTLQVQSTVEGQGNTYNVAAATGVTRVESANSLGVAGAVVNVNFAGLAAGTNVVVSGAASSAGNITQYAYTTASSTPTVTFSGGVVTQTINAAAGSNATSAVINSIGGTNGTTTAGVAAPNTIALTAAAGTVASLAVHAVTGLQATLTTTDFAAAGAALTVDGAAAVNLGNQGRYKTVDASANVGGVTVNLNAQTTTFSGSLGNDSVTLFNNAATAVAASASIDAGAGVDTLQSLLANNGNGAVYKNFELIDVLGQTAINLDVSVLTNSTITGAVISGLYTTGASLSNLVETPAGFNISVTGTTAANTDALGIGFKAATVTGSADVATISFADTTTVAGANTIAGTLTVTGIENLNVVSGGTAKAAGFANELIVTDTNLQTVTVTGANATILSVTAQALIGAATNGALTTVDASAATGRFTYTELVDGTSSGLTIKGSTGVDSITVRTHIAAAGATGANVYGSDTITLGAGADNVTITNATAQVVSNAAAATTIVDAATADTITTGAALAWVNGQVSTAAATDLLTALQAIATGAGGAGKAAWGQYAGNTYIVNDVAVVGFSAGDQVVKIVGLHSLSGTTAAGAVLTLAVA